MIRQASFYTKLPFLDLDLFITNEIVSSNIYDKQDGFNFEIVNFPFLDVGVPRIPSYYMVNIFRIAILW